MTNASGAPEPGPDRHPPVYLDSASAEPLHPAARETLLAALEHGYADPRRLHGPARSARLLLDNAREVVAECLGVRRDEVAFTSSGTEAVHRGILGLLAARPQRGSVVLPTAVEHSAVLHAAEWAARREQTGAATVPVDRLGRVSPEDVAAAARTHAAAVVAVQAANHEVGTVQPVAEVAELLDGVPLFVDASASAGRLPLPHGWTTAAVSARKWGGPAGLGVLLVRTGARWANPFPGDADERHAGLENVPAALAAAAALQAVVTERDATNARQAALVDRIRAAAASIPDVAVVGDPVDRLPHLVTFSCLYVEGEELVNRLDRHGFGVASGSACTASTLEPSHVLAAMGALTHGNVRVSLTRDTGQDEVERFLAVLPEVVRELRAEVGL